MTAWTKKPVGTTCSVGDLFTSTYNMIIEHRRGTTNEAPDAHAKLAHRYSGPAIIKRNLDPMTVELVDKNDKIIGKYYVTDLKIPRRSLRIK